MSEDIAVILLSGIVVLGMVVSNEIEKSLTKIVRWWLGVAVSIWIIQDIFRYTTVAIMAGAALIAYAIFATRRNNA